MLGTFWYGNTIGDYSSEYGTLLNAKVGGILHRRIASSLYVLVYKCLKIAGVFMNKSFKADARPMCIVGDGFIDMHATCRSIMNTKP
jgi:hypothetical protein